MTDRLLDARPHVSGQALVCYGDTLANVNIPALRTRNEDANALATLTVYPLQSPFGIVEFDSYCTVTRFTEKPALPYWINIGFLLCERAALDLLPVHSDMPCFLTRLRETGRFRVHRHTGSHLTINTEKERALAEAAVVNFFTVPEGLYT